MTMINTQQGENEYDAMVGEQAERLARKMEDELSFANQTKYMKRYIAFYYPIHKPSGGMNDSIGSFRNLRDAIDSCKFAIGQCEWDNDWTYHEAHVWDSETDKVAWAADDDLA